MPAAVLTIDINARLASLEAAVAKIPGTIGNATKGIDAQLGGLNSKLTNFGRTAAAAFGVPVGAAATLAFLKEIGTAAADGERSVNQLNAVFKTTGGSVGITARELAGLTDSLRDSTIFDDDDIRKAEAALLRFRTVQGDTFRDAIQLAPDVAAALGTDLASAAQALGRALSDPEGGMKALKAAGLALSEQQKDLAARLIEAGDKAGAQRIVLDELKKSVGGASESDNQGLYGATKRLDRAWGELKKTMGQRAFGEGGFLSGLSGILDNWAKSAQQTKISFADMFDLFRSNKSTLELMGRMFRGEDILRGAPGAGGRFVSGRITGDQGLSAEQEAAADAAREERLRQRRDQAYEEQQALLKRRAGQIQAFYQSELAAAQFNLGRESALYEETYRNQGTAVSDFFNQQRQAAEASTQAVLKGLTQQGLAIEALIAAPSTSRDEAQALRTQLIGIGAQSDQARFGLKKQLVEFDVQERNAIRLLDEQYQQLGVTLAQLRGDDVAAANEAFRIANRDLVNQINAQITRGSPQESARAQAALAEYNAAARLVDIRAQLNDSTRNYQLTLDELGNTIERINIGEQSGAITSIQALERKSAANALYVEVLKQELEVMEKLARESGRREDLVKVEQLRVQIEALAAQTDLLAQKFNDMGKGEFSQLLQNLANSKNLRQDWKQILLSSFDSVTARLNTVAADEISQRLFGQGGALSGLGGFFAKIFGGDKGAGGNAVVQSQILQLGTTSSGTSLALNSVTSAAQSAAIALASVGSGGGGGLGSLFGGGGSGFGGPDPGFSFPDNPYVGPGFGTYGAGTNSARGGWSWVGEFGRELMYVPPRSTIVPNHRIGGAVNTRSVTVNSIVNVMPGATRMTAMQAAKANGDAVRSRILRFGN